MGHQQTFDEQDLWARVIKKDEKIASCADLAKPWDRVIECNFILPYVKKKDKRESYALHYLLDSYFTDRLYETRQLPTREELLEQRVKLLEAKVQELEAKKATVISEKIPTKADAIYESLREDLESKYLGKIVAIDSKAKKVAGIGNSMIEAYENALQNSTEKQFSFKKVGSNYISRI